MLNEQIKGLSGGVQQRVGVARALVRNPKVLILDEPISHLEEELKAKMREDLRKLQRKIAVTTLYVTHDQIEAMVMADRIAIMNFGVLQQVDTPENVFHHPANTFVGGFIGEPPMNFLNCKMSRNDTVPSLRFGGVILPCPEKLFSELEKKLLEEVIVGVRDTQIFISENPKEGFIEGKVFFIEPRNEEQIMTIDIGGERILVTTTIEMKFEIDKSVWIALDYDRCNFFDPKTELNIFSGGEYGYC
jgi:multiple sugar transport system ATP-binding protein